MPLGRLVAIALGICVVAGVITAIADKGKGEPATAAEAKQAAPTAASKPTKAKKPFHGRTVYVTMKASPSRRRRSTSTSATGSCGETATTSTTT